MMLNTLLNYAAGYGWVFETVESTAAMTFHDWRGHVRFFTAHDLESMVKAVGFSVGEIGYDEVFYQAFFDDFFADSTPHLPGWRIPILKEHGEFRNDVYLVASKE